jgi:hypothetical protein
MMDAHRIHVAMVSLLISPIALVSAIPAIPDLWFRYKNRGVEDVLVNKRPMISELC